VKDRDLNRMKQGEQVAAERAAWLAHLRTAVDMAEQIANRLLVEADSAAEAAEVLAKLKAIRGELDVPQHLRSARRPVRSGPNRIDPISPFS
jgi:hypothetical protein